MAHSYEELKGMTVAQLREIAAVTEHEALQGYTQLNKDHLLSALCSALGVEAHAHHEVKGINKSTIKAQIRKLKEKRNEALAAHDHKELKSVRREIHHLKRKIHRATI